MDLSLNLLLLPLLGGYVAVTRLHFTAYKVIRYPGQRILLAAATVAVVLLVLARLSVISIDRIATGEVDGAWLIPPLTMTTGLFLLIGLLGHIKKAFADSLVAQSPEAVDQISNLQVTILIIVMIGILLSIRLLFGSTGIGRQLATIDLRLMAVLAIFAIVVSYAISHLTEIPAVVVALRISLFLFILTPLTVIVVTSADRIVELWNYFAPFKFSAEASLAFLFGALGWYPLNILYPYETALRRQIMRDKNVLDQLLYESAGEETTILANLHSGKVYVGKVESIAPNPQADDACIRLVPTMSGYRDPKTKKIVFVTYYDELYDHLDDRFNDDSDHLSQSYFGKVIPIDTIETASRFDIEIWEQFGTMQQDTAI